MSAKGGRAILVATFLLAAVVGSMLLDDGIPERVGVAAQAETPAPTITATLEVSPTLTLTPTVEATAVVTPTVVFTPEVNGTRTTEVPITATPVFDTPTPSDTPTPTIDYPATIVAVRATATWWEYAAWHNSAMNKLCWATARACLATPTTTPTPVRDPIYCPLGVRRF